jgi:hypothetical protein
MSVKPRNTPLAASNPRQNPAGHLWTLMLDCDRWSKPCHPMASVGSSLHNRMLRDMRGAKIWKFAMLLAETVLVDPSRPNNKACKSQRHVFGGTWLWSTHDPKAWYAKICIFCVYTSHIMSPCHVFAIFLIFCHLWQHLKCRSRRRWALSVPRWTVRPSMTCMVSGVSHLKVFSSKKFEAYLMYP